MGASRSGLQNAWEPVFAFHALVEPNVSNKAPGFEGDLIAQGLTSTKLSTGCFDLHFPVAPQHPKLPGAKTGVADKAPICRSL